MEGGSAPGYQRQAQQSVGTGRQPRARYGDEHRRYHPPPFPLPPGWMLRAFDLSSRPGLTYPSPSRLSLRSPAFLPRNPLNPVAMAPRLEVLAGLAFLFSVGFLLQILGCALYNNWWPMLTGLMYVMLPMPCLFFGGESGPISSEGGDWADAAKFLTGFSSVGSIAIPAILRHADLITGGAMWIEFTAFFILLSTVVIYNHVSHEDY